jgi:hypothetical protein
MLKVVSIGLSLTRHPHKHLQHEVSSLEGVRETRWRFVSLRRTGRSEGQIRSGVGNQFRWQMSYVFRVG